MSRISRREIIQKSSLPFVLYRLLKKHGIKICQSELDLLLKSHYAFPGILSISDVLDHLELDHEVFSLAEENVGELENLPLPLLCYEKNKNEYSLIKSLKRSKISYKLIKIKKGEIEFHTDLILIALFVQESKRHGKMLQECEKIKIQKSFVVVCFLFSFLVFGYIGYNKTFFIFWMSDVIIRILGLLTSLFLIKLDIDTQHVSSLTRKVCINNYYFNCKVVSQYLRLPVLEKIGVSIAEIGFLYFTVGLIYEIFYVHNGAFSLALPTAVINICGIPVIIGLLIYQVVRIKKLCTLCLAIYCLIVLEFILYISTNVFSSNIQLIDFAYFALCCFFTLMLFFLMKLSLVLRNQHEDVIIALQRIQNDPKLINNILVTSKSIRYSIENFDLIVGDKNATHKILFVPDMRCYSCAEVLKSTLNFINKHTTECVLIVRFFLFHEKLNQLDINVIQVVHAIAQHRNSREALNFLVGWLMTYPKDELKFEKYNCKQKDHFNIVNINHQISFYKQWSIENNFIRTPLLAINGQELPELLNIENLKYYFNWKYKNEQI